MNLGKKINPKDNQVSLRQLLVCTAIAVVLLQLGLATPDGWLHFFLIQLVLAAVRFDLQHRSVSTFAKAIVYLLAFTVMLGYTYWKFAEWENPAATYWANWIGTPIAVLSVPIALFFRDLQRDGGTRQKSWSEFFSIWYEILVLPPLFCFAWILVELFILGWIVL